MNIFRRVENLEWEIRNIKDDYKRREKNYWEQYWTLELLLQELGYEAYSPSSPLPRQIRKVKPNPSR